MSSDRNAELEWIRFREDALGTELYPEEKARNKFSRKIMENPAVPIGKKIPRRSDHVSSFRLFNSFLSLSWLMNYIVMAMAWFPLRLSPDGGCIVLWTLGIPDGPT